MIDWLLNLIPYWLWTVIAIAGLFVAWRFLGLRGMVAAGAGIGAAFAYIVGRKTGSKSEREKRLAQEKKARDIADQVDNDIGAMPPEKQREELKKW